MKEPSIAKNAILNTIKTVVSLVFPMISFPYASRVFGVEGMGRYNFSGSVISYFMLLAGLGIAGYAVREGGKHRNNKEELEHFCNEMFSINMYATALAYILLVLGCLFIPKLQGYTGLIFVLSLEIILSTLGMQWLYVIHEDFRFLTLVSIIMQLVSLAVLLLFVHDYGDLYLYALTTVMAYTGMGLFSFIHARKIICLKFIRKPSWIHMKPIMFMFLSTISSVIYINSDVTILGWLKGDYSTGLYSTSANIYKIVKQVLNSVVAVAVPRAAYYIGTKEEKKLEELEQQLMDHMIVLVLPAMCGLLFLSIPIVEVFAGKDYHDAYASLRILSLALLFAVFANFFVNAVLIPVGKEKAAMIMTTVSAGVNIGLNFILIPFFAERAAAATTVIAEAIICISACLIARKEIRIRFSPRNAVTTAAGCVWIGVTCTVMTQIGNGTILWLVLQVLVAAAGYFLLEFALKNPVVLQIWRQKVRHSAS